MTKFIAALYDRATLTVDYVGEDGRHLLRTGGGIAWRFNNPGNLRPSKKNVHLRIGSGTTGSGAFCIFPSYEIGRLAKKELLRRKYNDYTIPDALEIYSPSTENDTASYVDYIIAKTSLPRDKALNTFSDAQLDLMMNAMESYEGFNAKVDTRRERWVSSTVLTLSDGVRPIAGEEVKVKYVAKEYLTKSSAQGVVPPIVHLKAGDSVEVYLRSIRGEWQSVYKFETGSASRNFLVILDKEIYKGVTRLSASPPKGVARSGNKPLIYTVQSGDNLTSIAQRFGTTVSDLREHNHGILKSALIYPGQKINIYGVAGAPSKTLASPPAVTSPRPAKVEPTLPVNSKNGQPLALVVPGQRQAPWMLIALEEAKRLKGVLEGDIERNYHHETGASFLKTMSGSENAWCASFVNWVLVKAGYSKWKNSFRARAVALDGNFVEIDEPVYGAIGLIGTHHVCFVYAKNKGKSKSPSKHLVYLGGNQSDQINFSIFKGAIRYFVPAAYLPFAKKEISEGVKLSEYTPEELNGAFGIVAQNKSGDATR